MKPHTSLITFDVKPKKKEYLKRAIRHFNMLYQFFLEEALINGSTPLKELRDQSVRAYSAVKLNSSYEKLFRSICLNGELWRTNLGIEDRKAPQFISIPDLERIGRISGLSLPNYEDCQAAYHSTLNGCLKARLLHLSGYRRKVASQAITSRALPIEMGLLNPTLFLPAGSVCKAKGVFSAPILGDIDLAESNAEISIGSEFGTHNFHMYINEDTNRVHVIGRGMKRSVNWS